ncbi:MAG TPA: CpaD family pilus assembly lipoprotein [Stellaceae bacterium]|nr:CpaD family pilus assembly lipoprotein [Stellaceae bacterium]
MNARFFLSLCAGLGIALAACSSDEDQLVPMAQPKQLKVDYTELKQPVDFVHGSAKLAPGEGERLRAFLSSSGVTADDHVYLETASDDRLAAQRIGSVSRELDQRGIGAKVLPASERDVGADSLLVKVERYVVTLPNCPDWTKSPYQSHDNQVASNYGCTTATDFGLMVADPRDLVVGRTLGPAEGDPAIAAIERYRAGKPKDLPGAGSGGGYSPVTIEMPGSSGSGGGSGSGQ